MPKTLELLPQKITSPDDALKNCLFVSKSVYESVREDKEFPLYLVKNGTAYLTRPHPKCGDDHIQMGSAQRQQWVASLLTKVLVTVQQPSISSYAASVTFELKPRTEPKRPLNLETEDLRAAIMADYIRDIAVQKGLVVYCKYKDATYELTVADVQMSAGLQGADTASGAPEASPAEPDSLAVISSSTITYFSTQSKNITLQGRFAYSHSSATASSLIKLLMEETNISGAGGAAAPATASEDGSAPVTAPPANVTSSFTIESLGIGGLDEQFRTLFRRAFISRIFPANVIKKFDIRHVRGILLFGPAGTGKTATARLIGTLLSTREPKIVSGPEVLDKYVGGSEENVRKLFADAEAEYAEKGDDSELHLIILDELDAICRQRGSKADSTGTMDSVVNQILAKMDGVKELPNVLIIGMTNRRDLIDVALLRPGRFELQLEIGLPDLSGREQILRIHLRQLKANGALRLAASECRADEDAAFAKKGARRCVLKDAMTPEEDFDYCINDLACRTANFSGAEIAGLVRSAVSFAMNRVIDISVLAGAGGATGRQLAESFNSAMSVTMAHFYAALGEVHAAFGKTDNERISRSMPDGILHATGYDAIIEECLAFIAGDDQRAYGTDSVLLHAPVHGAGKTALCAEIARRCDIDFVKFVSAREMIETTSTESGRINYIISAFQDTMKTQNALLVMDGLENLIGFTPVGMRFNSNILNTLVTLLVEPCPEGKRLVVLATTGYFTAMDDIGLAGAFSKHIGIKPLGAEGALRCLEEYAGAHGVKLQLDGVPDCLRTREEQGVQICIRPLLQTLHEAERLARRAQRDSVSELDVTQAIEHFIPLFR